MKIIADNAVALEQLMITGQGSVNPSAFKDEIFELLSIPAYDKGQPEILRGADIGSSKKSVQPGDVLLSRIVPHIRRAWVVPESNGYRQIASSEWIVLRYRKAHPNYLRHMLMCDVFHAQFMNTVAGVGGSLLRARPSFVAKIEIPLPPLLEQKRIATILDKADAVRRKRGEAIEESDTLKNALFLELFGDPRSNPNSLPQKPLGQLIKVKSGDFLPQRKMVTSGPYPVYGGNGVSGHHDKYLFDEPSIVIGRVGVYCGAIHTTNKKSWITDNALYVAEKSDSLDDLYLTEALRIANLNQYASRCAQPLISGSRIYPVEILVPPPDLQKKFSLAVGNLKCGIPPLSDRIGTEKSRC